MTDVDEHDSNAALTPLQDARPAEPVAAPERASAAAPARAAAADEMEDLRRRIRSLEMALAMSGDNNRGRNPSAGDQE